MKIHFETLKQSRKYVVAMVKNLTNEQLNFIPDGFNNNMAWNLMHLVVTEQLLCYRLSGLPCAIPEEWIEKYSKGTIPTSIIDKETIAAGKKHLTTQPEQLEKDYTNGLFKSFASYTTSANVTLKTIEDAIVFNTYHEGIHLGILLQLLKLIRP